MDEDRSGGIIVTGASSGIGAATAAELARRGFTVACLSRRGTVPTIALGNEERSRLLPYRCDVTDSDTAKDVVTDVAQRTGGIAGIVNNAGRQIAADSADMDLDTFRSVLETNLISSFSMCRLVYPHMRSQKRGVIVNMGSFFDRLGARRNLAYCASKAAIASMTRTLAIEWAGDGISVVTIAPGYILTELNEEFFADESNRASVTRRIPVRRIGQSGEVGRLIAALMEERISFLTGTTIYIDGGQGINP